MADPANKYSENVDGPFYVDEECTFCETCIEIAPDNFASQDDEYAYVCKQPENDLEKAACIEAMESCPTEAIGDDG
ncbi:MAG: ferredoxin [Desulfosudaceae bacterium]